MTNISVVGLGVMGLPIALNLLGAGHNVTAYNRSHQRLAMFGEAGGAKSSSVGECVKAADVIITVLPDSPDVESVVGGAEGVFALAPAGALWIDLSTIRPDVAIALADDARDAGLRPLDAPVSGGEKGAIEASLSIMVGGSATDFEAARGFLQAIGTKVVRVGESGAGQTVKAANQLIVASHLQALGEAVAFLEAQDVDIRAALSALGGGLAGSKVLEQKGSLLLDRDFQPGFRLELHHKDLGIAVAAARAAGVFAPLGALVAQLVASMVERGYGGLDHSALYQQVLDLSGRS